MIHFGRITHKLTKTIERFNEQSSCQTKQMLLLTWVIAGLTVVLTVLTAWLAFME